MTALPCYDNCEFTFEGKSYRLYEDYVQAKRSRTAGIFADMLAARLAIAEEMTAPGPLRAKNPRDDLTIPPLLPRRKSSHIARTVSEGIDLVATMQSSSPAGLRVVITDGSSLMTTRRSSPLSRPGGTDGSSLAGSLLISSGEGGDDREDGANLVTAAAFAAAFVAECDDDEDDNDDDIGLVIAESLSTINLDAHLTHEEVMFGVPEVDDFGAMVERVVFDDIENGTTTMSSYCTPI